MDRNTFDAFVDQLWSDCQDNRTNAAKTAAKLLTLMADMGLDLKTLNQKLKDRQTKNLKNLAEAMTTTEPYLEVRYSKVYQAKDLTEKDLAFIKQGTDSGEFVLIASDNRARIESDPGSCAVGCWCFANREENFFSLLTDFERNRDGMPFGAVSFTDHAFTYVRFVINPYGKDEFTGLPSDKKAKS